MIHLSFSEKVYDTNVILYCGIYQFADLTCNDTLIRQILMRWSIFTSVISKSLGNLSSLRMILKS